MIMPILIVFRNRKMSFSMGFIWLAFRMSRLCRVCGGLCGLSALLAFDFSGFHVCLIYLDDRRKAFFMRRFLLGFYAFVAVLSNNFHLD